MFSERSEQITLAGSILLAVGAFSPMIDIGGLGTVSYSDAADPEVYLLVLFGLAASGLIVLGKKPFTIFAAIGVWLVLLWPMIKNMGGDSRDDGGLLGKVGDLAKNVTDPLTDLTARLFSNVFNFEWGGYLFLIGLLALTVGSVMVFLQSRAT